MVDEKGDALELLYFTSFTRELFNNFVDLLKKIMHSNSIVLYHGKPAYRSILRRRFNARNIVAMTLKYLLSRADLDQYWLHIIIVLSWVCDI